MSGRAKLVVALGFVAAAVGGFVAAQLIDGDSEGLERQGIEVCETVSAFEEIRLARERVYQAARDRYAEVPAGVTPERTARREAIYSTLSTNLSRLARSAHELRYEVLVSPQPIAFELEQLALIVYEWALWMDAEAELWLGRSQRVTLVEPDFPAEEQLNLPRAFNDLRTDWNLYLVMWERCRS